MSSADDEGPGASSTAVGSDNRLPGINVRYALSRDARRAFAKALGSLDLEDAPALPAFAGIGFVPLRGDVIRWEAINLNINFVVANRCVTFWLDGSMTIDLAIELEDAE